MCKKLVLGSVSEADETETIEEKMMIFAEQEGYFEDIEVDYVPEEEE